MFYFLIWLLKKDFKRLRTVKVISLPFLFFTSLNGSVVTSPWCELQGINQLSPALNSSSDPGIDPEGKKHSLLKLLEAVCYTGL